MSATTTPLSQDDVKRIFERFDEVNDNQKEILYLIKGNPINEFDKGMLGELKDRKIGQYKLREDIDAIILQQKKFMWMAGGFMLSGVVIGYLINLIVNHVIPNSK